MTEFKNCVSLYNAFGENGINNLPILDIGDRHGSTGYIDFIRAEEMKNPVMRGVDSCKRPFIAIRVRCVYEGKDSDDVGTDDLVVGTFFQRYTDDNHSWAYGTCYRTNMIYWDSRVRLEDMSDIEARLKKLIVGESIRDVDFFCKNNTRAINTVEGNGEWVLTLR